MEWVWEGGNALPRRHALTPMPPLSQREWMEGSLKTSLVLVATTILLHGICPLSITNSGNLVLYAQTSMLTKRDSSNNSPQSLHRRPWGVERNLGAALAAQRAEQRFPPR
ncbi:hypothetical protein N7540_011211 [Penicillium herquei]|nr:hypothetical protein N7540_011211 [Penicillium herquei]